MADRKVRYILEVDYDGESVTARAADDLREVDQAAKEASAGLEQSAGGFSKLQASVVTMQSALGIAEQGLQAVASAAKFAYETLSEGAALADARGDFEDLAASVGSTADALENELSAAAGGLMTDAELIGQAGEMMALGLGLSKDEIVTLTGLAAELDWNFKTLTDTLNTGSTRGLKELGLSIDEVKGKMATLEEQGMSTDEAFRWAIIEAAEEKLGRVGRKSEEASGQIQQLEVVVANVQDEFARGAAEGFAASLGMIAGSAPAAGAALEAAARGASSFAAEFLGLASMNLFGGTLDYFIERGMELQEVERQQAEAVNFVRQERADLAEMNQVYAASQEEVAEATASVAVQGEMATVAALEYAAAQEWLARATVWVGDAQERARAADYGRSQEMLEQAYALQMYNEAQEEYGTWVSNWTAQAGDNFTGVVQGGDKLWDLNEAMYNSADAAGAGAGALADMGVELGLFKEKVADAALGIVQQQAVVDYLAGAAAEGRIAWQDYATAVQAALDLLKNGPPEPKEPTRIPVELEMVDGDYALPDNLGQPIAVAATHNLDEITAAAEAAKIAIGDVDAMEPSIQIIMDILPVTNGTAEVQRLLAEIPETKSVTVDFTATGLEFLQELRAAGVLP